MTGDLRRPRQLTAADLRAWMEHTARADFACATSGTQQHTFAGPLLYDVLRDAEPRFAPTARKERARFLVCVRGADGHRALLSWAEIDPEFSAFPVLLAMTVDGVRMDRQGPQLVVPQDHCGTRYIQHVVAVHVDGGYAAAH
nr:molybdopterin-dependent oxidoreductase [Streptacidiphilus anmyonensis]